MSITMTARSYSKNLRDDHALSYWTSSRREQAIPARFAPLPYNSPLRRLNEGGRYAESPSTNGRTEGARQDRQESRPAVATAVPFPARYPDRLNGKLFFRMGKVDYFCSAGAISDDLVLTAAHCLCEQQLWASQLLYWPAYPYKGPRYEAARCIVPRGWYGMSPNMTFDFGLMQTRTSMGEVRYLKIAPEYDVKNQLWISYGYPSYGSCGSDPQMSFTIGAAQGTVAGMQVMSNNNMTRGASGGHWVTLVDGEACIAGVTAIVVGTNAFSPPVTLSRIQRLESGIC